MTRKFFCFFIVLLLVLSLASCPDVIPPEEENASRFTLSGDIKVDFMIENPTNTVTIKLLPDDNYLSTPVYSTTASVWRTDKAIVEPSHYLRYSSYSLSGIAEGTYYLYAEIHPSADFNSNATYGPFEIEISANIEGRDIDFTTFSLSGDITAFFTLDTIPTNTVTIKLLPDNNPASTPLYSYTTTEWSGTKAIAPISYEKYASFMIADIVAGTYYIYGEITPTYNIAGNTTDGPAQIVITTNLTQDIIF